MAAPAKVIVCVLLSLSVAKIAADDAERSLAATAFAAPSDVTAVLVDDAHVDLKWKNRATAPGGVFIEFNLGQEEEFSLLAIAPPEAVTFRHPDVARDTRFNFRIRPFFGGTSNHVEIKSGDAPQEPVRGEIDGPLPERPEKSDPTLAPKSLRTLETISEASPAELSATLPSPTTVDLRWRDRASDEDGYLVEFSEDGGKNWIVCALLPANAKSFRKTMLPGNTKLTFAVRAFFHGQSSRVASIDIPPAASSVTK